MKFLLCIIVIALYVQQHEGVRKRRRDAESSQNWLNHGKRTRHHKRVTINRNAAKRQLVPNYLRGGNNEYVDGSLSSNYPSVPREIHDTISASQASQGSSPSSEASLNGGRTQSFGGLSRRDSSKPSTDASLDVQNDTSIDPDDIFENAYNDEPYYNSFSSEKLHQDLDSIYNKEARQDISKLDLNDDLEQINRDFGARNGNVKKQDVHNVNLNGDLEKLDYKKVDNKGRKQDVGKLDSNGRKHPNLGKIRSKTGKFDIKTLKPHDGITHAFLTVSNKGWKMWTPSGVSDKVGSRVGRVNGKSENKYFNKLNLNDDLDNIIQDFDTISSNGGKGDANNLDIKLLNRMTFDDLGKIDDTIRKKGNSKVYGNVDLETIDKLDIPLFSHSKGKEKDISPLFDKNLHSLNMDHFINTWAGNNTFGLAKPNHFNSHNVHAYKTVKAKENSKQKHEQSKGLGKGICKDKITSKNCTNTASGNVKNHTVSSNRSMISTQAETENITKSVRDDVHNKSTNTSSSSSQSASERSDNSTMSDLDKSFSDEVEYLTKVIIDGPEALLAKKYNDSGNKGNTKENTTCENKTCISNPFQNGSITSDNHSEGKNTTSFGEKCLDAISNNLSGVNCSLPVNIFKVNANKSISEAPNVKLNGIKNKTLTKDENGEIIREKESRIGHKKSRKNHLRNETTIDNNKDSAAATKQNVSVGFESKKNDTELDLFDILNSTKKALHVTHDHERKNDSSSRIPSLIEYSEEVNHGSSQGNKSSNSNKTKNTLEMLFESNFKNNSIEQKDVKYEKNESTATPDGHHLHAENITSQNNNSILQRNSSSNKTNGDENHILKLNYAFKGIVDYSLPELQRSSGKNNLISPNQNVTVQFGEIEDKFKEINNTITSLDKSLNNSIQAESVAQNETNDNKTTPNDYLTNTVTLTSADKNCFQLHSSTNDIGNRSCILHVGSSDKVTTGDVLHNISDSDDYSITAASYIPVMPINTVRDKDKTYSTAMTNSHFKNVSNEINDGHKSTNTEIESTSSNVNVNTAGNLHLPSINKNHASNLSTSFEQYENVPHNAVPDAHPKSTDKTYLAESSPESTIKNNSSFVFNLNKLVQDRSSGKTEGNGNNDYNLFVNVITPDKIGTSTRGTNIFNETVDIFRPDNSIVTVSYNDAEDGHTLQTPSLKSDEDPTFDRRILQETALPIYNDPYESLRRDLHMYERKQHRKKNIPHTRFRSTNRAENGLHNIGVFVSVKSLLETKGKVSGNVENSPKGQRKVSINEKERISHRKRHAIRKVASKGTISREYDETPDDVIVHTA